MKILSTFSIMESHSILNIIVGCCSKDGVKEFRIYNTRRREVRTQTPPLETMKKRDDLMNKGVGWVSYVLSFLMYPMNPLGCFFYMLLARSLVRS